MKAAKPILVVEDDRSMRWLLQKQLEKLDYESDAASNGQEAVLKLTKAPYRLIIMDISMPVMDGLEATRRIRAREQENNLPRTPIVAVTGASEREDCMLAGVDDFYEIPLSIDDMRQILRRWLAER
ncbi:MAG TPA: response regulator [Planktothrix sp.]|jgi:CheY-like chemotaxis protein